LFEDDFNVGVKKFVPLASDVGDMVKCLSIVVADLCRAEPLRDGSPPCDGELRAEVSEMKNGLVFVGSVVATCVINFSNRETDSCWLFLIFMTGSTG